MTHSIRFALIGLISMSLVGLAGCRKEPVAAPPAAEPAPAATPPVDQPAGDQAAAQPAAAGGESLSAEIEAAFAHLPRSRRSAQ